MAIVRFERNSNIVTLFRLITAYWIHLLNSNHFHGSDFNICLDTASFMTAIYHRRKGKPLIGAAGISG